ncbi:CHAT domain-containing protein [Streptomyces sp. MI02-7b]|uniref:CHAT domain-containing protein n=1 Tax=Streptomyces sp. MI02-7b TaxID=462941 RepID=UPI0029AE2673|nr:CHAT domain-containing protein [Streptomyces sp. MI02-7b]MDX3072289.1 CHAT domain-containing protein [Streptomyces sp. MI02-7b]
MSDARAAVDRMLARFGVSAPPRTDRIVAGAGTTPGSLLRTAIELLRAAWGGERKPAAAAALALIVLALDTAPRDHPLRARLVLHLQLAERTLTSYGDVRVSAEVRHHLAAQTQHRSPDDLVSVAARWPGGPAQEPFAPADPIEARVDALLATLPPDDLCRPGLLARLAHEALIRYEYGAIDELPGLWPRARAAFEGLSPRHVDAPDAGRVAVLAGVTWMRARPQDRDAVDVAVRGGRLALAATREQTASGGVRDRHKVRTVHLALAAALMCTLPWAPRRETVDEAMEHLEAYRAEGLPDDDAAYEINVASLLTARALMAWDVADADEAARMLGEVLRRLPPDHPLLPHIEDKAARVGQLRSAISRFPRPMGSMAAKFLPMAMRVAPALPPLQLRTVFPSPGAPVDAPPSGGSMPPDPPEPRPAAAPQFTIPVPPELAPLLEALAKGPGAGAGFDPAFVADAERRLRAALDETAPGSRERVEVAGALMSAVGMRYMKDQDAAAVEEATAIGDRILAELPDGSPARTDLVLLAAPWHHMRAMVAMDVDALRVCCEDLRAALDRLPEDNPRRIAGEVEYANGLTNLAGLTQNAAQAAEARRLSRRAARRVLQTPVLADLLGGVATSYGHWADFTEAVVRGDPDEIRAAEAVLAGEFGSDVPAVRFESARNAMGDALERHAWGEAADAAERALEILPLIASRAVGRDDRRTLLDHALLGRRYPIAQPGTDGAGDPDAAGRPDPLTGTSLSRTGCAAAIAAGRPAQGLALLEQGRAVLMNQDLEGRADLGGLAAAHPALAAEFRTLAARLRRAETPDEAGAADAGTGRHLERHVAAAEWEGLLMRVRARPGFERFLLPPTEEEMRAVAAEGPVVVVNVDRLRCDALVVTEERITAVPLLEVTEGQLALRARAFLAAVNLRRDAPREEHERARETVLDTLAWLWHTTAEPVLRALGLTRPLPPDAPAADAPRLWWSASGPLAYLPLHAAGLQRKHQLAERRTVLDHIASSYTPTLRALRHARRAPSGRTGGRLLAVGRPTGHGGSAGASAREIAAISDALGGVRALEGEAATPGRVREALRTARWVHFACHGVSDTADPSESHLALHGGTLSVGEVSRQELRYAELAVLLACHTAHTGLLPDEAVHLASAFQVAGYPQVVGALWEAGDTASAVLAGRLYAALRAPAPGAVASLDAGRALNHITRALRTRYARSPEAWAAFVHIGR